MIEKKQKMQALAVEEGMRFERIVTVRRSNWSLTRWECRCDCGTVKFVDAANLTAGHTRSCGCLLKDVAKRLKKPNSDSKHPLYHVWQGIKVRCDPANKNKREYRRYAGRGIRICDEWRDDFRAFVKSIGPRPSPSHSIDRINNDGNYEPGNVRWATSDVQRRNCIAIHPLDIRGETRCVMDWAKESGLGVQTIYRRLQRGWDPEEAVFHIGRARVDHEDVRR